MDCLLNRKLGCCGGGDNKMQTQEEIQLELAMADALRTKQCEQWLAEYREAINTYNEHVGAHGVFSDSVRSF